MCSIAETIAPRASGGRTSAQEPRRGRIPLIITQNDDVRFRLLIEAVSDYAIYMLNRDGVVISWNPGAQRFKGYTESEILGEHFSRFYTEEDKLTGLPARAL